MIINSTDKLQQKFRYNLRVLTVDLVEQSIYKGFKYKVLYERTSNDGQHNESSQDCLFIFFLW